ncbi:unnamed protein product (macronuclear) [Paramecium tetraurelia]|uniref:protein-serine/threonine phosphatase n=1 Tax=Paramecium tetraurelia TaxID=5888 RepID=A0DNZ2_PARTE|nr:uncharacterized protein GSPATT00018955001 [Paramecium tetraurelia]CAK84759.1 unnamed protein product [Paramecium tetraurelia]|eukprot:XP_001452156.1 hypothetical protein (macronuclear) [Paramecium tetraurelia strain d4-2]
MNNKGTFKNRDINTFLTNYQSLDKQTKKPFEYLNLAYSKQFDFSPIKKQSYSSKANDTQTQYKSLQEASFLRQSTLPNYEPTRCSSLKNGIIKAYAANTNQGLVRDYNEDRVSIILNIIKPQSRENEQWPKCSYFGVYDGHGGSACADFLRDNLHQFVVKEPEFPWNPINAIKKGFETAEKCFLQMAQDSFNKGIPERSGSCAVVVLIVGDSCYVANVGDSRAILSTENGRKVIDLSKDHKPELEKERIIKGGGQVYQTHGVNEDGQPVLGPVRVNPGRLSVSRTFGDIEAKFEKFGGNPKIVIAEPEIKHFKIVNQHDFIVLGSDGIFDTMSSKDVINGVWKDIQVNQNTKDLPQMMSNAVESVIKESLIRKSTDNVTLLIIAFSVTPLREEEIRVKTISYIDKLVKIPQSSNPSNLRLSKFNDENNPFFMNAQKLKQNPKLTKFNFEDNLRYRLIG